MRKIILASSSPRRREILSKLGLAFEVYSSGFEEDLTMSSDPKELSLMLAMGKAKASAKHFEDALIISADQVNYINNDILGKPHTRERQIAMLRKLSGSTHEAITSFVILDTATDKIVSDTVVSRVTFRQLTNEEIYSYAQTGEGLDGAGGYAIQGLGSVLVEKVEGDYLNIVGLPLSRVVERLKEFGVRILD